MAVLKKPSVLLDEYLARRIAASSAGDRLPTDQELARQFLVSVSTVKRVMGVYVKKQALIRIPGKGTFLPFAPTPGTEALRAPVSSAQLLADTLFQMICQGELTSGEPLPQVKFLCYRFQVTDTTVTAAYHQLAARGYVTRIGKTFWVGRARPLLSGPQRRKDIYLFNYRSDDFSEIFRRGVMAKAYEAMEKELSSLGFFVRYQNTREAAGILDRLVRDHAVPQGMVFTFPYLPQSKIAALFPLLQRFLERMGEEKPRFLFDIYKVDYHGELDAKVSILAKGHVLTSSARALVDYLLKLRWPAVAFFAEENRGIWNFTDWANPLVRVIKEIKKARPDFRYTVFVASRSRPRLLTDPQVMDTLMTEEQEPGLISPEELTAHITVVPDFRECFKTARSLPLWVFSSSAGAAQAVAWARRRRLDIPRECPLLALDNDPRFYHLGLTTCGPDWDTIGYLMAHAVIGDFPVARTTMGFIRTSAAVIEKLTTPPGA